jgi:hypothetical protein
MFAFRYHSTGPRRHELTQYDIEDLFCMQWKARETTVVALEYSSVCPLLTRAKRRAEAPQVQGCQYI